MRIFKYLLPFLLATTFVHGGDFDIESNSNEERLAKLSLLESGDIKFDSLTNSELDSYVEFVKTKNSYEAIYYEELIIECLTYKLMKGEDSDSISQYLSSLKLARKSIEVLINDVVSRNELNITFYFSTKRNQYESISILASNLEGKNSASMASSYLATEEMIRDKSDKLMMVKLMYVRGSDEFILDGLIDVAQSASLSVLSEEELVTLFFQKVNTKIKDSMWGRSGKSALKRTFKAKIKFLND